MFIFSCYAGLANIEINVLAPHHITNDNKGGFWLVMQRRKTLNTNKRSFAYVGFTNWPRSYSKVSCFDRGNHRDRVSLFFKSGY